VDEVTTALFLFTTALTSVTGFRFPIHGLTPALEVRFGRAEQGSIRFILNAGTG
jgi:hypothetical protein